MELVAAVTNVNACVFAFDRVPLRSKRPDRNESLGGTSFETTPPRRLSWCADRDVVTTGG
ncbi:MAG: hypothetical protein D6741_02495 [Planctomycetota bacterium]|nr:MAG: hypothetical protein D6741_02495 [Planctomycetota bacterium]